MQTIVAVVSIVVEKEESVEQLNALLHEFGEHIIGRMGIPYRAKGVNIVSVASTRRLRLSRRLPKSSEPFRGSA